MRLTALLSSLSLTALAGCGPVPINDFVSPTPTGSTVAASIQLLASSRPDQQLAIKAEVLTLSGKPVAGAAVTFTVTNGTITPATATTDADGYASATASAAWQNTITATSANLSTTQKFTGVDPNPLTVSISNSGNAYAGDEVLLRADVWPCNCTPRVVEWTFGDGDRSSVNVFAPRHTYRGEGRYTATVSITDNLGRTTSTSSQITVLPRISTTPAPPPILTPAPTVTASITCTSVTALQKSCTATPMYNGVAVPSALVSAMTMDWYDGTNEPVSPGVAKSHTYAVGSTGTRPITVNGVLTTGETFSGQITIGVG